MRVFLDECVDRRLACDIAGHDVRTAGDQGWRGVTNGRLMALVSGNFDVFVTVDRNLSYQQNLLHARTNRLADLQPLIPGLLNAISTAPTGVATVVG